MSKPPRTPVRRVVGGVLVVVTLVGIAAGTVAAVGLVRGESEVEGSRFDLPGSTRVDLDAGTYEVWLQGAGGAPASGNCSAEIVRRLTRSTEPTFTTADGRRLTLDYQDDCDSEDPAQNEDKSVTALRVEVERDHEVELTAGTEKTPAGVSMYLQPMAGSPWPGIVTIVVGFVVGAAALVLRIERF